jgi:hypothetical protein
VCIIIIITIVILNLLDRLVAHRRLRDSTVSCSTGPRVFLGKGLCGHLLCSP